MSWVALCREECVNVEEAKGLDKGTHTSDSAVVGGSI